MAKQILIEYLEYEFYYDENWKQVDEWWWSLKGTPTIGILCECVFCGSEIDPQIVLKQPLHTPLVCEKCKKKEVKHENV